MIDYKALQTICNNNSTISRSVIDEFLIYYSAQNDKTDKEADKRLAFYRHVTSQFPKSWINMIKTQYIAHKIFKKDGLINKYLKHSAVKNLKEDEIRYLEQQTVYPWRFSFSMIINRPADHFYKMEDVFTGDEFLLYSPGISDYLKNQGVTLCFNLIAYNGSCWQTYGPISVYKSFEPDDIFFFATELRPGKNFEYDEDIMTDVEENPVPYMMLLCGANYPLTFHKKDQIVSVLSEFTRDTFDTKGLDKKFRIEYNEEVYRISLKQWDVYPHFAKAFYDETKKVLLLSSLTDRGFDALVTTLNTYGYDFPCEPDIRVNLTMITTAKTVLNRDIVLSDYDHLFEQETSEEDQEYLDKLNKLMDLAMPDINAGKEPDIEDYARQAGLDPETAREVLKEVMKKFGDIG